ncbi:uncharacterized protein N7483_006189 [Penicillium malachiteum]|uniref:uncharacterized protein n=1 Tax=Penicillium malachiteum TaxID=1324776 RepID=UPI002547004E|nr:uncharacterized protein N7483_006189 [Penicillium malachiteum]KAJ5731681.1 hypothetical protein N7483_006189 [Penicillium malachiteum]
MAASSRQTLIESPHGMEIDLEDLSRQTSPPADGRNRPYQQQSRRLAMWMAENIRMDSWRGTSSDKVIENLCGHEALKKYYRKIARRPNLHTVERILMYKATNADDLHFAKHDTWAACFERILSTEEINDTAVFEVCVISTDTMNLGSAFSFIDKAFLTSYDRRQQAYSSLSEIIIRIFQSQWRLDDEIMASIMESLHAKELCLSSWRPKLPSYEDHTPFNIAPDMPLKFEFKWIPAPHYATDLSVYVFRPYGKHPQVETLDVILTSSQFEQLRRAIVVVNSHNTLTKLRSGKFSTQVLEHNTFSLSYILHLFAAVCSEVSTELVAFTTRATEEINYMVYEGRLRPSGSKIQYLQHLEDCHIVAKDCCKENGISLKLLLDKVNSIQGPRSDDEAKQISHLELVLKDLEYLHDEVESSLIRASDLCRDLRQNLDLLQVHRTSLLGILAALYLPLSFVTSFLGMNLNQYTPLQPFWHNVTVVDGTNSNELIVDSGGNQSWSLDDFFEIAMPLMVGTIFIPLVIGSIIRITLQGLARGRIWWRLFFATIVVRLDIMKSMIKERRLANEPSIAIRL